MGGIEQKRDISKKIGLNLSLSPEGERISRKRDQLRRKEKDIISRNQKETCKVDHLSEKAKHITDILSVIDSEIEELINDRTYTEGEILKCKLIILNAYRFLPPIPESSICSFLCRSIPSELSKVKDIVKEIMQDK